MELQVVVTKKPTRTSFNTQWDIKKMADDPKACFYVPGRGLVMAGNSTNMAENVAHVLLQRHLEFQYVLRKGKIRTRLIFFPAPEDAGIWSLAKFFFFFKCSP